MKQLSKLGLVCLLAMLTFGAIPVMPLRAASDVCNLTWRVVPSPNVGAGDNGLLAVRAVSENDIWAVGYTGENAFYHSLLLHWDGAAWTETPIEDVGALSDIVAISPTDIWIAAEQPLHWDGASWSVVASPFPLQKLSALASDDIWGMSDYDPATVIHWDGAAWAEKIQFVNPQPNERVQYFNDIIAFAPNDVWVVGSEYAHSSTNGIVRRWIGTTWIYRTQDLSGKWFSTVTGTSAVDVWLGGWSFSRENTEHWNGSVYKGIPTSYLTTAVVDLASFSTASVWSVGYTESGVRDKPLVEHWTGDMWRLERMPKFKGSAHPSALEVLADTNVWAVGLQETENGDRTLILHGELPCLPRPVVSYPPATPILRAPTENKLVNNETVTLRWDAVEFARKYQIQVFAAADTTKPLRDLITRKQEIELENLARGIYAWHARACNPLGCSAWAEMRTFRYTVE